MFNDGARRLYQRLGFSPVEERGVYLLELVDLEPLAVAGAWTFTFVLAPLRITGGVGSPVNPLAII